MATWIKASNKFPDDPTEKCFRRNVGAIYQYFQAEDFEEQYLIYNGEEIPYSKLEWLDESAPSIPEDVKDVVKKISQGFTYWCHGKTADDPDKSLWELWLETDDAKERFAPLAGHAYRGQQGESKQGGYKCQHCGNHYDIDLIIPDDLWAKISPNPIKGHKGGGLLCGCCIMNKLESIIKVGECLTVTDKPIPLSIVEQLEGVLQCEETKLCSGCKAVLETQLSRLRELLQKDFPSNEPDKLQRLRNVLSDESEKKRLRGKTIEHLTIQTVIAKIDLLIVNQ